MKLRIIIKDADGVTGLKNKEGHIMARIVEPGWFGMTKYEIRGNEVRTPGWFGTTKYVIDSDGTIREPGWSGQIVGHIKD